jgi:glutamate-5-semialdehyde dehydrogenase
MNVQTKPEDAAEIVAELGRRAKAAAVALRNATTVAKNKALTDGARLIRAETAAILAANARDLEAAKAAGMSSALQDRLLLNDARIEAMAKGLDDIAALPDPVGAEIERWQRPNGLEISRVRVPIGIIGVIYESRPNVTADAGALCIKSGNVVVLRGGRSLIDRVTAESRVPVLRHYDGICHVYVDRDADVAMARDIVANAKMRRVSVCGAAETLLIDRAVLDTHLMPVIAKLHELGCEVRGDGEVQKRDPKALAASEKDWRTEYLEPIISVATVDGVDGAIHHIATYGSQHTESIVTDNAATADRFLREVDSAIVMHNASTQFADGAEFGLGAEIGISTNRMHARGPVGLVELTTYKNIVRGKGTLRP